VVRKEDNLQGENGGGVLKHKEKGGNGLFVVVEGKTPRWGGRIRRSQGKT